MATTSSVLQDRLPCEPPPGLYQPNIADKPRAVAASGRRHRDNGPQNQNGSPAASKDRARPMKATEANSEISARRVFQPYHSLSVPKKRDLEASDASGKEMTTVMLRNIPNKYTQSSLLEEIDGLGFADTYNFFYLPMDIHNRTSVGYAFINFITPKDMQVFVGVFTDHRFIKHKSQKIARVSPAHIQGFLENVCHFSSCAVTRSRNSQYRPVVVYNGQFRDLAEILLELSASSGHSRHGPTASDRILLAPEVLQSLASGVRGSRPSHGLNPTAAEFVPAAPQTPWTPTSFPGFDPGAAEFVPQAFYYSDEPLVQPILGTSPPPPPPPEPFTFQTQFSDTSFTIAKKGLEEAVSMLLAGAKTADTQSTEGGESGAGSGSGSPRSVSDKEAQSEAIATDRLGA